MGKQSFSVRLRKVVDKMRTRVSYLMFPDDIKCIFCGDDIQDFYEKPYCQHCEKELKFNNGHRCLVCDTPIEGEEQLCYHCKNEKKNFVKAFCPFIYEGKVKNSVLAYKDSNRRYMAKGFAILIANRILESEVKIDKITYIPMTKKKERERSFNQSKLLAEEIGKILDIPVLSFFNKEKDVKGQKYLTYKERRESIIGMYTLKPVRLKKSENVLIVDDVITTTSTINYCAGLIYSGVNNIFVCGIARTNINVKYDDEQEKIKLWH